MKYPKGVDTTLAVLIVIGMLIILIVTPRRAQTSSSVRRLGAKELTWESITL